MNNKIHESVAIEMPKYSAFDLSREQKLSCKFGKLYPILLEEVLPGDQYKVKTEVMARLAPMLAPVMARIDIFIHYFYVPNRIVWDEWEEYITGGDNGDAEPPFPNVSINTVGRGQKGRISDYFGLPVVPQDGTPATINVSQLPFRAYHEIWNEYYRDQDLQEKFDITDPSAPNNEFFIVRNRAWRKITLQVQGHNHKKVQLYLYQ